MSEKVSRSIVQQPRLSGNMPVDPDAVHETEPEHDHEHKRAAVTDQGQRYAGDWQHRNCHSHVLENMREDERGDPNHQQHTELIPGEKGDEETRY